jgi:hypothetical protein
LARLLERCIATDRQHRPADFDLVLAELDLLTGLPAVPVLEVSPQLRHEAEK